MRFLLLTLILLFPFAAFAEPPVIAFSGSSTVTGAVMIQHEDDVQKKAGVIIDRMTTSSGRGFTALIEGRTDIAMTSSPVDMLIARQAEKGVDVDPDSVTSHYLGQASLQFIVKEDSPVESLTIDQIRAVLLGEVTHWKELGYPELGDIRMITEHASGGMYIITEKHILNGQKIEQEAITALQNAPQVAVVVAQLPNAIGLFSEAIQPALRKGTRPVTVTGLDARQYMALITRSDEDRPAVLRVIEEFLAATRFMRQSSE